MRWRFDRLCGKRHPLPDGTIAECNPDSNSPCCFESHCTVSELCTACEKCVDYRVVRDLRKMGENCALAESEGFLKYQCFNSDEKSIYFKCVNSDVYYKMYGMVNSFRLMTVSNKCPNDPFSYQACGISTAINLKFKYDGVLCGGFICDSKDGRHKFMNCDSHDCNPRKDCKREEIHEGSSPLYCDGNCDQFNCEEESECNGFKYGRYCGHGSTYKHPSKYCNLQIVADSCVNCNISESAVPPGVVTCLHYVTRTRVAIYEDTRCSTIDVTAYDPIYPYCLDYSDQTNCSDPQRVGGSCLIKGYNSTVSKFVVCYDYNNETSQPSVLCDDEFHNICEKASLDCKVKM